PAIGDGPAARVVNTRQDGVDQRHRGTGRGADGTSGVGSVDGEGAVGHRQRAAAGVRDGAAFEIVAGSVVDERAVGDAGGQGTTPNGASRPIGAVVVEGAAAHIQRKAGGVDGAADVAGVVAGERAVRHRHPGPSKDPALVTRDHAAVYRHVASGNDGKAGVVGDVAVGHR